VREGGVSEPPYDTLNLASHVGDNPDHVTGNRRLLRDALALPADPVWLEQVHGTRVVRADAADDRRADAAVAMAPGQVCAVMTADCLPVLFATGDGQTVAAAHAGWRGLLGGVLEATVEAMQAAPRGIMAWLGPAISQEHFEVGDEVRQAFIDLDPSAAIAFIANARGRWQADLYRLARQHLNRAGIDAIYGGDHCTYRERDLFFSHRRDARSGRMASLIWLES
jgi:YfiH family protein